MQSPKGPRRRAVEEDEIMEDNEMDMDSPRRANSSDNDDIML
jgi:hypothetical protein